MRKAIDILIDTSASMGQPFEDDPSQIAKYKAVLSYVKDTLPKVCGDNVRVGLCTFGSRLFGTERDGTMVERLLEIEECSESSLTEKFAEIPSRLPYPAGTPLADALLTSIYKLREHEAEYRAILVFSDGKDNALSLIHI